GGDDQVGIVKGGAKSVTERVTEFTAFMNGTGRFRGDVARDAAGEGELFEQFLHAGLVRGNVRVNFAISAFEPGIGDDTRTAMAGPDDVNHVQITFFDKAIEVDVDEVQARRSAPMTEEAGFYVIFFERL